ncbi:peroxidasin homolog [Gigantopelta aegis]|uniref:peroxidasin homolog n=1 Tax=Gigantopelta aegis TaxID=1735272 RepID=UPI001B88940E|nr:peroxidasin homolog [Gigantopelta aegis]
MKEFFNMLWIRTCWCWYFFVYSCCFYMVNGEDVKPSFLHVPAESLRVPPNSSVTLTCKAAGSPPPNITWTKWKNAAEIPASWVVSPGVIHIQRFQQDNVGQYTCTAVNSLGSVNYTTNITILNEHVFVSSETTVKAGSSLALECHASSTAKTVTWITPTSGNFTVTDIVGQGKISVDVNHTLHVARTDRRHHGLYTCVVTDEVSSLMLGVQVNVESPPVITVPPVGRQVLAGEHVTFTCGADGYPPPTIEWFKDLPNGSLTNLKRYTTAEGTIVIPSASQADVGIYRCIANNTQGSTVAIATLNVIIKPFFHTSIQDKLVQIGDEVTLQCKAEGSPVPVQRWERYGKTMIIGGYHSSEMGEIWENYDYRWVPQFRDGRDMGKL